MKKVIKTIQPLFWAVFSIILTSINFVATASASSLQDGVNAARGDGQPGELFGGTGIITSLTNTLLFIVGILAVIMLIIGGLRYVVSGGNSTAVTAAKNTILYAIVGLVVSFLAFAAINFILGNLGAATDAGYTDV